MGSRMEIDRVASCIASAVRLQITCVLGVVCFGEHRPAGPTSPRPRHLPAQASAHPASPWHLERGGLDRHKREQLVVLSTIGQSVDD